MRDYKNIKAYQLADSMVIDIYRVTKCFPKEEMFGLTSQLRRAAVSVPANIVEGSSRQHKRDYLNFLYISRGSVAETGYLLELSDKLGYLKNEEYKKIEAMRSEVSKTLYGLIVAVTREV